VLVATLSRYQSAVNCSRAPCRTVPSWLLLNRPVKDEEVTELSKCLTSWIIVLDRMTGNVVMSDVDALTYVVLSKAEMHVPYGGLVGNVINEVSHKPRSL